MKITIEIDGIPESAIPKESEVPAAGAPSEKREYSVGSSLVGDRKMVQVGPGSFRWFGAPVFSQGEIPTGQDLDNALVIELGQVLDDFSLKDALIVEVLVSGSRLGPLACFREEFECFHGAAGDAVDAALVARYPGGYSQVEYQAFIEDYVRNAGVKGGDPV